MWLEEAEVSAVHIENQIALFVDRQIVSAFKRELNLIGVCAWGHDEVVFQLPLIAVVDQVDTFVEIVVLHFFVGGNLGAPFGFIAANEVVDDAGELVGAGDGRRVVGAGKFHAND